VCNVGTGIRAGGFKVQAFAVRTLLSSWDVTEGVICVLRGEGHENCGLVTIEKNFIRNGLTRDLLQIRPLKQFVEKQKMATSTGRREGHENASRRGFTLKGEGLLELVY